VRVNSHANLCLQIVIDNVRVNSHANLCLYIVIESLNFRKMTLNPYEKIKCAVEA
jgi:hypothetical protein